MPTHPPTYPSTHLQAKQMMETGSLLFKHIYAHNRERECVCMMCMCMYVCYSAPLHLLAELLLTQNSIFFFS